MIIVLKKIAYYNYNVYITMYYYNVCLNVYRNLVNKYFLKIRTFNLNYEYPDYSLSGKKFPLSQFARIKETLLYILSLNMSPILRISLSGLKISPGSVILVSSKGQFGPNFKNCCALLYDKYIITKMI